MTTICLGRAPIAFITPIWRVCWISNAGNRVGHEQDAEKQCQDAQRSEHDGDRLEIVLKRQFSRSRDIDSRNPHASAFHIGADPVGNLSDRGGISAVVGEEIELVVTGCTAKPLQRLTINIAIRSSGEGCRHPGKIVCQPRQAHLAQASIGGLDSDLVTKARLTQPQVTDQERGAFEDDGATRRGPVARGPGFWIGFEHLFRAHLADACFTIIGQDEKFDHLPRAVRPGAETQQYAATPLGIGDCGKPTYCAHHLVIEGVVGIQRCACREHRSVALFEVVRHKCVHVRDSSNAAHPGSDRDHNNDGAHLVAPQVAEDLSPARSDHGLPHFICTAMPAGSCVITAARSGPLPVHTPA
jgi:hypothetical protein